VTPESSPPGSSSLPGADPEARPDNAVSVAIAQMFSARLLAMALAVGGMAVLARLLTPSDFGIFAFGLAVFAVAQAISQFGLVHELVRRENLERRALASAGGLALALAVTLATGAVLVALVSGRPIGSEAMAVVIFLGLALVSEAVAMPYEALRQRNIAFRLISVLAVVQAFVEIVAGVLLALAGLGPAALAAGIFASRTVTAGLLIAACPSDRRTRPSRTGWRQFARFGGSFVTARFLSRIGELAIVTFIREGLGVAQLGLYNRAGAVHSIPDRTIFEAVNPVILPALTRALRGEIGPDRVYLHKLDYLAAVCWPAFGAIAVLADPLVAVLLGDQWTDAVVPVRILAIAGMFMPFTKMSMKLFVAVDRMDLHLRAQGVTVVAMVVGAGLGSLVSLPAACAGLAAAQVVQTTAVWRGVNAVSVESMGIPWSTLGRGLVLTAATLVAPVALVAWIDLADPLELAIGTVLGGLSWGGAMIALRHRLVADVRSLRSTSAASGTVTSTST